MARSRIFERKKKDMYRSSRPSERRTELHTGKKVVLTPDPDSGLNQERKGRTQAGRTGGREISTLRTQIKASG
jgi:hypothetical protein